MQAFEGYANNYEDMLSRRVLSRMTSWRKPNTILDCCRSSSTTLGRRYAIGTRPAVRQSLLGGVCPIVLGWTHCSREVSERLPIDGRLRQSSAHGARIGVIDPGMHAGTCRWHQRQLLRAPTRNLRHYDERPPAHAQRGVAVRVGGIAAWCAGELRLAPPIAPGHIAADTGNTPKRTPHILGTFAVQLGTVHGFLQAGGSLHCPAAWDMLKSTTAL